MRTRNVHAVSADGQAHLRGYLPGQPAGLGWLPDGTLLISSALDRDLVAIRDGWRHLYASLGEYAVGQMNDLLVDARGRAYVGSVGIDLRYQALKGDFAQLMRPAPLVLVDVDGSVQPVTEGLRCANGMALRDGELIVAESGTGLLHAFPVLPDGRLGDKRVFAELDGMPDGLCLDAAGFVWVAMLGAERFIRVADGGEVVGEVACPGRSAVDCVLGGANGRTLYGAVMTTPGTAFSADGQIEGAVEAWQVEVPGPGW
jgi:sugar lactone lactonase YvrE